MTEKREKQNVRLGLLQHACPPDAAKEVHIAKVCEMIHQAASRGAELVVTQELFAGSYFPQVEDDRRFDLAEPVPGPTSDRLCRLASELGISISASLFERRAPGVFHNTSVLIDPKGDLIGRYRKMHIPDDPRFYEKYYFTPGDLGFQSHTVSGVNVGMLICWDQWFPEAARLAALHGAELLLYPTAIGWYHGETEADRVRQREAWQLIQRSHAVANGVYVAAVNRVGIESDLKFWGGSFVADPGGQVIAQASEDGEEVLVCDCEFERIDQIRRGWPFLRDRRIDAYDGLSQRLLDD